MGRFAFTVVGALNDDLVAGVGQPVQGAIAQNGVVNEAQPLVHGAVAGDDEAGRPVSVEDEFVKVGGLLRSESVQAKVIQNEQVRLYPDLRGRNRYICLVVKRESGYSFILTAYLDRRIKGE